MKRMACAAPVKKEEIRNIPPTARLFKSIQGGLEGGKGIIKQTYGQYKMYFEQILSIIEQILKVLGFSPFRIGLV